MKLREARDLVDLLMVAIFLNLNQKLDKTLVTARMKANEVITSQKNSKKRILLLQCRVILLDKMIIDAETKDKEALEATVWQKIKIQGQQKGNKDLRERTVYKGTIKIIKQLLLTINNKMDTVVAMQTIHTHQPEK